MVSVSNQQLLLPAETTSPTQEANLHLQPPQTKPQPMPSQVLALENYTAADIAIVRTRAQAKREQQQQRQDDAATALSNISITSPEDIPDLDNTNVVDRPSSMSQDNSNISTPCLHQTAVADMPPSPPETTSDFESAPRRQETLDSSTPSVSKDTPPPTKSAEKQTTAQEESNSLSQPDYTIITSPFTSADLIREQKADTSLKSFWDAAADPLQTDFIQKGSILYAVNLNHKPNENPYKIVVPTPLRPKVLDIGHACSGHFGSKKTKTHIEAHFYWQG